MENLEYEYLNPNNFKKLSDGVKEHIKKGAWILIKFKELNHPIIVTDNKIFILKKDGSVRKIVDKKDNDIFVKYVEKIAVNSCSCCGVLRYYKKMFLNIPDFYNKNY